MKHWVHSWDGRVVRVGGLGLTYPDGEIPLTPPPTSPYIVGDPVIGGGLIISDLDDAPLVVDPWFTP